MKALTTAIAVFFVLGMMTPTNGTTLFSDIGFERTCTVEMETATWCGFCPYAESALRSIEGEYAKEELVIVSHHYKDSLSQKNSTERIHAYGTVATPTSIFNGNSFEQGGDPDIKNKYIKQIDYQLNRKTPFLIHLQGDIQEDFLKLNAHVLGWGILPEDLNYTFIICEKSVKASGRTYNWVCRDVRPKPGGTPFVLEDYGYKEFELNWNIPSDVDWKDVYALFVVESFAKHDIYQTGIWRKDNFQVEQFNTPLGDVFEESPDELRITFTDYKMTNDGIWEIIDSNHVRYESTGSFDRNTLVIKPTESLPKGKKYVVHVNSGNDSIGNTSTFLQSPAFLFFEIEGEPAPPTEPSKNPPKLLLSTLGIDMGLVEEDTDTFEFEIENRGDEPLVGEISVDCDWVAFEENNFSEVTDEPLKVTGHVSTNTLEPGMHHSFTINVTSNGGNGKIGVKLELPIAPPILDVSPEVLVFEGESISETQVISITNLGGAELIGIIDTSVDWLIVDKAEFSGMTEVGVSVMTDEFTAGEHTASIDFDSNGGKATVQVKVIIPEKIKTIELMYGSSLAVVDGEIFTMDGEPYLIDGHLMIPTHSSAQMIYDGVTMSVSGTSMVITHEEITIALTVHSDEVVINGEGYTLPISVTMVDVSMYVPIEFITLITDRDVEITIKGEPRSPAPDPIVIELVIGNRTATVNNEDITLETPPTIINSRTVVPLRFVTETFGFEVNWNAETREITLKKDALSITLKADCKTVKVADDDKFEQYDVDPAPTIIDGHTMVPIRFLSDILSADIEWIGEEKKIVIKYQP